MKGQGRGFRHNRNQGDVVLERYHDIIYRVAIKLHPPRC